MEFFISLFILLIIKVFEWTFTLIKWSFKAAWWVISMPFKLLFGQNNKPVKKEKRPASKKYSDPINKAMDHWENKPEDLDMEDMFWLDELLGDD